MPTSVADWEWEFKVNENSHFGHSHSQYFQKFEYQGLKKMVYMQINMNGLHMRSHQIKQDESFKN